jgi:hypothetical protein
MMDGDLFDKLEHVARLVRKNEKPFGGIQVRTCWEAPVIKSLTAQYLAGHCRRFLPVASGVQKPSEVRI